MLVALIKSVGILGLFYLYNEETRSGCRRRPTPGDLPVIVKSELHLSAPLKLVVHKACASFIGPHLLDHQKVTVRQIFLV